MRRRSKSEYRWYQGYRSSSWRVDETYVRVGGKWKYLFRAVDNQGRLIDFMLSDRQNTKAARRFLAKALKVMCNWPPVSITTGRSPPQRNGGSVGRRGVGGCGGGHGRGTRPRLSGDQPQQAAEDEVEDRLIGRAGRQMDLDLGFQFDDAGGDLDQPQPQRVELRDPPGRGPGHQCAQAPQQPI